MRFLELQAAEASVGGENLDHILLRSNPGKAALLEEFLHGTQKKVGVLRRLNADLIGGPGRQTAEKHVKLFMIRHKIMLGIGEEDVKILYKLIEAGL
ncbi:MAG: hypothetical protein DWQ02_22415 [Bacteroidetes bacterium]|nr:MAG: hypothetical protein DWQ02_22415 [Bacteroidota bacterium]